MNVQRTDQETGRLKSRQVMPGSMVEQWFTDCAAFNISHHSDRMRMVNVVSQWDTAVYLHDNKQRKIHMQLSKFLILNSNSIINERKPD